MIITHTPQDPSSALSTVPTRQLRWITGLGITHGLTHLTTPTLSPTVGLTFGFVVAGFCAAPNTRAGLIAAALSTSGAAAADLLGVPLFLGALTGAAASTGWHAPFPTDRLDGVHAALTALIVTVLAMVLLLPSLHLSSWSGSTVLVALAALTSSSAMWLPAWRHDHPAPPSAWDLRSLPESHQRPVLDASQLYAVAAPMAPDTATRRGLHEVLTWVLRLQKIRFAIQRELAQPHLTATQAPLPQSEDEFTRERHQATHEHLRRLDEHRKTMQLESERSEALMDYALAFLADARASLLLGQLRPGSAAPSDLPEVLRRLRDHALHEEARHRTESDLQHGLPQRL